MKTLINTLILGLVLLTGSLNAQKLTGQALIDSLRTELVKLDDDTHKVRVLGKLSFKYYRVNPDSGIFFGQQGAELALAIDYPKGANRNYNSLGVCYHVKGNHDKALDYYHASLKMYEELGNKRGQAGSCNNIGIIYNSQSNYPKALEYYQKSLKMYEDLGDKKGQAASYNNIGAIYSLLLEYSKALEYYRKSLNIRVELGDKLGQASMINGIGGILSMQSRNIKALEYYQKALKMYEDLEDKRGQALSNDNIGIIYEKQSNYPLALEYFQKSMRLSEELGDPFGVASAFCNIGMLHLALAVDSNRIKQPEKVQFELYDKKQYLKEGIFYLQQGVAAFDSIGELTYQGDFTKELASAYAQQGDYKQAYQMHIAYKALSDSIHSEKKAKELGHLEAEREQLEAQYEAEHQAKITIEKQTQRNLLQYLGLGVGVIILIMFMLFARVINMKEWVAQGLVFVTIIFLFEFVLVLIDPITDKYSEGIPIIKFGINMALALVLFPMHHYFEKLAHHRIVKN